MSTDSLQAGRPPGGISDHRETTSEPTTHAGLIHLDGDDGEAASRVAFILDQVSSVVRIDIDCGNVHLKVWIKITSTCMGSSGLPC